MLCPVELRARLVQVEMITVPGRDRNDWQRRKEQSKSKIRKRIRSKRKIRMVP
jgi:hypothetical protein